MSLLIVRSHDCNAVLRFSIVRNIHNITNVKEIHPGSRQCMDILSKLDFAALGSGSKNLVLRPKDEISWYTPWWWWENNTLPRGGMYWKIRPPEDREICRSRDFAPRGPRDCPRAKPEGNLEGRGVQNPCWGKSRGPRKAYFPIHPNSRQCIDILFYRKIHALGSVLEITPK